MAIYKFRPRYTSEDTASPYVERRQRFSILGCIVCCFRTGCSSRLRMFTSLTLLCALWIAASNMSSIIGIIENQSPLQAHRQSYGFVDVPKWKWTLQREFYKRVHSTTKNFVLPSSPVGFSSWYESNVLVDFICPSEELIGNNWWICNPKHLDLKRGCTVYYSGPPFDSALETSLREALPTCTIHIFDPSLPSTSNITDTKIQYYPWGFAETNGRIVNSKNTTFDVKTMKRTRKELGHRQVDLLLLHCNGCEWNIDYSNINQVVVVMSNLKNMHWFDTMNEKNYVLFHKEQVEFGGRAFYQSLSYMKLRNSFFA